MSRPSDSMQPAGKRRPGDQLTKDNYDDEEEGPGADPGTWGKADQATMQRRKVVRARRGGAAADPAPTAATATPADGSEQAGAANPFAGVSLAVAGTPAANPFAGVSLLAAAKAPEAAKEAAAPEAAHKSAGAAEVDAASKPAEEAAATAEVEQPAGKATDADAKELEAAQQPAVEAAAAAAAADKPADAGAADVPKEGAPAVGSTPSLFGGTAGFGGFGNSSGGFGSLGGSGFGGGFGGFAAAAKDGSSGGGSLFGSYTAPQPGGLFAPVPAFGAAGRASKDGGEDAAAGEGEGEEAAEGDAVFGGPEVTPVVQLSEVPKQTGEEEEEVLYAADGTLFEFVNGKEWRERGKGDLRLNLHKASRQARLVMRQRGSHKLLLNANLYPKMATSKMVGGKGVTFAAVNAAATAAAAAGQQADKEGKEKPKEDAKEEDAGQEEAAKGEAAADAQVAGEDGKAGGGKVAMRTYAFKAKSADKIDALVVAVDQHKASATAGSGVPAAAEDAV
ncbi:hypothetical protein COO60DRAFT_1698932 [Scenedesmus sp. NREL 46B-D3]|nr:hypothetical protein COO60DRAFT_1698932 [Scenedesmus sp. NREL 46B-D3]